MSTASQPPKADIPVLESAQRLHGVPERLVVALDARDIEQDLQAQWLAQTVEQSLQALRPELERLARDTLQRQAQAHWQVQAARFDPP